MVFNGPWIYVCDSIHKDFETFDVTEAAFPQSVVHVKKKKSPSSQINILSIHLCFLR